MRPLRKLAVRGDDMDTEVLHLLDLETGRQSSSLSLIASENIVSDQVRHALGSSFTNKTVEGRPKARFHTGCTVADEIELLARARACDLFRCKSANVQPHSCTQANHAALLAVLEPGETVLSMSLRDGGHISHGLSRNLTGKLYKVVHYGVRRDDGLVDLEVVEALAHQFSPKVIIVGSSSYSRELNFEGFAAIAKSVGATLLADVAHIAGLVVAGVHASPAGHADIVTTSTYKTLRGPRGGIVLANDDGIMNRIDKMVFPGLQGTPCLNTIAAKAVCLGEAKQDEFRAYARKVVLNARHLSSVFSDRRLRVVTGGTDTHLVLVDLRDLRLTGIRSAQALERAGILCNMNLVPFDEQGPNVCSGLRFGLSAATTLGLTPNDIEHVGNLIVDILEALVSDHDVEYHVRRAQCAIQEVLFASKEEARSEEEVVH